MYFHPKAGETPSLCPVPTLCLQHPRDSPPYTAAGQCSRTPGSSPEFLLRACKDILLFLGRGPMASPTRSHHLIYTGCLVLLKEAMPEVRHTWKAEFSPCSPSLPSAHSHPPHQQEQSSIHPRETQLQPSETLGYCNCYPCVRWFKTPGWGPEGKTMLASSLWTHDLGTAEELGGMVEWCWWPWLHLPPPFL